MSAQFRSSKRRTTNATGLGIGQVLHNPANALSQSKLIHTKATRTTRNTGGSVLSTDNSHAVLFSGYNDPSKLELVSIVNGCLEQDMFDNI